LRLLGGLALGVGAIAAAIYTQAQLKGRARLWGTLAVVILGFFLFRTVFDGGVAAIEAVNPASTGYLGGINVFGFDLMILVAWPMGGLLAAGAAWVIGKTALGLRADYLAIATLGIAEIIIAVMKNEDWLARGVKNVKRTCNKAKASCKVPLAGAWTRSQHRRFIRSCCMPGCSPLCWSFCCGSPNALCTALGDA